VLLTRISIGFGRLDLDPDSDGKNDPQKKKKNEEMYGIVLMCLNVIFCGLEVLL
jgi:hypothetical protein